MANFPPPLGDGTVRVWSIASLTCDQVIHSCHDVGDIFCIVYTPNRKLFFGCQNTSIQWYDFNEPPQQQSVINSSSTNNEKTQFFKLFHDLGLHSSKQFAEQDATVAQCVIRTSNVYSNAHDGYIYCMTYTRDLPNLAGQVLITGNMQVDMIHGPCRTLTPCFLLGSGDGYVKVSLAIHIINEHTHTHTHSLSFHVLRFGPFRTTTSCNIIKR